jgi:hypothetical protein
MEVYKRTQYQFNKYQIIVPSLSACKFLLTKGRLRFKNKNSEGESGKNLIKKLKNYL